MGVAKKGRRNITVANKSYIWYIAFDSDTPYYVLNIASFDKALMISCPIKTKTAYMISKGNTFQNQKTDGKWNRYLLPFDVPEIITPKFVSDIIFFATQNKQAKEIKWNGTDVPV